MDARLLFVASGQTVTRVRSALPAALQELKQTVKPGGVLGHALHAAATAHSCSTCPPRGTQHVGFCAIALEVLYELCLDDIARAIRRLLCSLVMAAGDFGADEMSAPTWMG